jgi:hypothetical protein
MLAHLGAEAFESTINEHYFMPGLHKVVQHHVKSCVTCTRTRPASSHNETSAGTTPHESWSGPFQLLDKGDRLPGLARTDKETSTFVVFSVEPKVVIIFLAWGQHTVLKRNNKKTRYNVHNSKQNYLKKH